MAKFKPYKLDVLNEFDISIPKSERRAALEAAADALKEAMLDYIGEGESPVSNGKWVRKLSKKYEEFKGELSSADFANLELTGEMLDSLSVEVEKNKLVIDVGSDQYGKAEGHITGEYGENWKKRYPRQFMPQGEQKFKRDILQQIKDALKEFEDGEE
jgi:hypothetical protein